MFEYFGLISDMKKWSIGGVELHPLVFLAIGFGLLLLALLAYYRLTK